ncbi:MAG: S1 family peptidase [Desulfurococcales archaeon]|nr:S1 family peptidase [Desulfurococcales archaeon]
MKRPVPSRVVARLLEVLPDDAVLKAEPVFFSNYVKYSKLDLPVDKLVQLLVDYIRKHPASAKILVSSLQKEAERLGLTTGVITTFNGALYDYINSKISGFYITNHVDHGDSGGIVYTQGSNGYYGLGIVVAIVSTDNENATLVVPIFRITDDIGVKIYTG